jgi:putative membrane protein
MPAGIKEFLKRWIITTAAVLVALYIVPGIRYDTVGGLLVATFILGILNTLFRPLKILLGFFTLGIFTLIFNGLLLYWVGSMVRTFHVDSFKAAFWGALIISIVSFFLNIITGTGGSRIKFQKPTPPSAPPPPRQDDGGGPIIDV